MGIENNLIGKVDPLDLPKNAGLAEAFSDTANPDLGVLEYGRGLGLKGLELVGIQLYLESGGATCEISEPVKTGLPINAGMTEAFSGRDITASEPVAKPDLILIKFGRELGLKGLELVGLHQYDQSGGAQPA